MFESLQNFIVVIAESKNVFQWNPKTEYVFWIWLLNDATLSISKAGVIVRPCENL